MTVFRVIPLLFHPSYQENFSDLLDQLKVINANRHDLLEIDYEDFYVFPCELSEQQCQALASMSLVSSSFTQLDPSKSLGVLDTCLQALQPFLDSLSLQPLCIDLPDMELACPTPLLTSEVVTHFSSVEKVLVPVFDSESLDYSYISIDSSNQVDANEKADSRSHNACAGVYIFSQLNLFADLANTAMKNPPHFKGRYYITPILNHLSSGNNLLLINVSMIRRHK